MKPKIKRLLIVTISLVITLTLCAVLFVNGFIKLNTPSLANYPVRDVDVSEYQGTIDWQTIAQQEIQFAFIRATEGSSYTDETFKKNWSAVSDTDILAGAYHFFSFDSTAAAQAANFISAVPNNHPMLPPVVDVELYGSHRQNPPDAEGVRLQLDEMLLLLEAHYGVKPILYTTQISYQLYLANHYKEHAIWIRDVFFVPSLADGRQWTFWQYSDKGQLDGYNGTEKYIDLNVYAGTLEDLQSLSTKQS